MEMIYWKKLYSLVFRSNLISVHNKKENVHFSTALLYCGKDALLLFSAIFIDKIITHKKMK